MRAIVFGASGFIGTALCKRLQSYGYELDRPLDNILNLSHRDYWRFEGGIIFNLACPTSPLDYLKHPLDTLLASTKGVDTLAQIAKLIGATLVQASTIRVATEHDHLNKHAPYVEGKRCAETILNEHAVEYPHIKIARMFSTFGPEMKVDDTRVIPTFIRKALRNETIQIYGNGEQGDLFTYSEEVASLLVKYAIDVNAKPIAYIGDPWTISIEHLARLIISLAESSSRIEYKEGHCPSRTVNSFDSSLLYTNGLRLDFPQALSITIDSFRRRME